MDKKNILTYQGLKKLEDELQESKSSKKKRSCCRRSKRQESRETFPRTLSTMQQKTSREISKPVSKSIEKILKNAEVVVEEEVDLDKISIGCNVKILDIEFDEELEYKIVGSTEANSLKGKISNESPVGKALLGKQVGDIVKVETPGGEFEYKVLSIHRAN